MIDEIAPCVTSECLNKLRKHHCKFTLFEIYSYMVKKNVPKVSYIKSGSTSTINVMAETCDPK